MISIESVGKSYESCNCCHKRNDDGSNVHITFSSKYNGGIIITLCKECLESLGNTISAYQEVHNPYECGDDYCPIHFDD